MAYQILGDVIINNSRDLIGVSTAGITDKLYVGDKIVADAASGILTAAIFKGDGSQLSGIVTDGGSGGTVLNFNVTGIATFNQLIVTGVTTFQADIDLENNDILNGGAGNFASLDVAGHIEGDSLQITGLSTLTTLAFAGAEADENFTGITTDLNESAGATEAVTAEGVKSYVDGSVGAANQLNFAGDTGLQGEIDLASEVLDVQGVTNEIVTDVAVGLGNTVSIGLSTELVLPGSMAFDGGDADEVVSGITTDLNESAAADELVTAAGVVAYVGGQVGGNTILTIADRGSGIGTIALGSEQFVINGTANEVTAVVSGDPGVLTVGLTTDVTIAGDLTVTDNFAFDGGQLVNVIGIETSLVDTTSGVATNTSIPTQLAVKTYVDAAISETGGALNFVGDSCPGSVDLRSQTFQIFGTSLEVDTVGAGTSITIGLPDDVTIGDSLSVTGQLEGSTANFSGICTAKDFNSTSDIRKKENIVEIEDAVSKVQAIRGVTFDWKDGSGSSGGIIAQEVEAILPTLIREGEDHKTVIYNGVIGLLVQAVKEQADQIAALQEKLG